MFDLDIPAPHSHYFNADKWKSTGVWSTKNKPNGAVISEIEYYQNTCLGCGVLVQKIINRDGKHAT